MTAKPMRVLPPVLSLGMLLLLLTNTGEAAAQELKDVFIGAQQDRIAAIEVRGEEVRVYRSTRREKVDGTQIVVTLATGEGGIPLRAAYSLIKAISKKNQQVIAAQRAQFLKGAREKGVAKRDAAQLFELISNPRDDNLCG